MANVSSIVSVIELCQAMSELQVFTHISTFAVFMPQRVVKEKIYTMAFDVNHFLADLKLLSDQEFESKYGQHIDDYINTYHMTKTIAERLLYERCSNLPLVIIRPSVVMPSYKEPFPGWFQGIQLSTGLMGLWTSGLIRTCIKHKDFLVPVIPVDTLGNFILVSTWIKFKSNKVDITIYNCTTDVHNSPTMGQLAQIYGEIAEKCPSSKVLRSPLKVVPMASNIIVYQIKKFTHHTLFAHMADLFLRIKGEKPVVKDITRRMNIYLDVVEKELKRNKYFETDNFRQLWTVLDTEVYSAEFNMDLDSIDWTQHSLDHYMEFRRKILKESDSNLAHAKTMMKRLMLTSKCMDWSLNLLILTTFGYLIQRSKMIPTNAFTGLLQVIFRRN